MEKIEDKILLKDVLNESVNNIGMSFATGCVVGTIYYFSYGCIIAPKGQRIITALKQIRDRSTLLGGSIALWSGTFTFSKGMLGYVR